MLKQPSIILTFNFLAVPVGVLVTNSVRILVNDLGISLLSGLVELVGINIRGLVANEGISDLFVRSV